MRIHTRGPLLCRTCKSLTMTNVENWLRRGGAAGTASSKIDEPSRRHDTYSSRVAQRSTLLRHGERRIRPQSGGLARGVDDAD